MKFWAGRWQAIVQSLYLNPVGERTNSWPARLPSAWQAVNGLADRSIFERVAAEQNTDFPFYMSSLWRLVMKITLWPASCYWLDCRDR
jgi:hypothetical protein